ncbi:hypothetical protein ACOME3_002685 [Neoechinorhynchus agilis]
MLNQKRFGSYARLLGMKVNHKVKKRMITYHKRSLKRIELAIIRESTLQVDEMNMDEYLEATNEQNQAEYKKWLVADTESHFKWLLNRPEPPLILTSEKKNAKRFKNSDRFCMFFDRTAVCREGLNCSRPHRLLNIDQCNCLVFLNVYNARNSLDELTNEFFKGVLQDFLGNVKEFIICSNECPQLKGNIYVEFSKDVSLRQSYDRMAGTVFMGKVLQLSWIRVLHWGRSICATKIKGRFCPRGDQCSFIHPYPYDRWRALV